MKSKMVINVENLGSRIALLEDNQLVELTIHEEEQREIVGNIYKGIVKDNVPGMGAAFINIGLERTALLHFRDAEPDFLDNEELEDENFVEEVKDDIYKMGKLLEVGNDVMVQVEKAPVGKKGARLTGEISIPGRYMVFIPNKNHVAISRKISTYKEIRRLKKIFGKIKDKNVGIIVRTDANLKPDSIFKKEYSNLKKTWQDILDRYKDTPAPSCIYDENDLSSVVIRNLINKEIDEVILDSKPERNKIIKILKRTAPEMLKKIKLYQEKSDIFDAFGIEKEIYKVSHPRIYMKNGSFIVIQKTEALVSIDINTGSFVGGENLEQTVSKTNIDAMKEIARLIRLFDLSGMIIIDFIDMKSDANKQKVFHTFKDEMKKDYSVHKIFLTSPLNLIEMTRKRSRSNLLSSLFETCPFCDGIGRILDRRCVANNVIKWLNRAEKYHPEDEFEIYVHPLIYQYIFEKNLLSKLNYHFSVKFQKDEDLAQNQFRIISLKSKRDITNMYKT